MGILRQHKVTPFLEEYGFSYDPWNCTYYTNFTINETYVLFVEINLSAREIEFLTEYECGGTISKDTDIIPSDVNSKEELIDFLDDVITERLEREKRAWGN